MPAAAAAFAVVTVNDPDAVVTYRAFADPINVPAAAFVGTSVMMLVVLTLASVTTLLDAAAMVNVPVDLGNSAENIPTSLAMSWFDACNLVLMSVRRALISLLSILTSDHLAPTANATALHAQSCQGPYRRPSRPSGGHACVRSSVSRST